MSGEQHKTFRLGQRKAAGSVTPEKLAAINMFTHRDFTADELSVRTFVLAHNCVDRDGECFDEALLRDFAKTLPGKGLFVKHPTSHDGDTGPGEGLFFDAYIETMSLQSAQELMRGEELQLPPDRTEVHLLLTDAYLPKTADNASLLTKMDAGVACYVSIGFTTVDGYAKRVSDAAGHEYELRRWNAPGKAHEGSLVWLGAQPGARSVKSATRSQEANAMTLQEQLDAANATIKTMTTDLDTAKAASAPSVALKTALGDDATLVDSPAQLVGLVAAGKAYRKTMVDALVQVDRVAGVVGDDDAATKSAAADYDALPTPMLERQCKRACGDDFSKALLTGSDPNATPAPAAKSGFFASATFQK